MIQPVSDLIGVCWSSLRVGIPSGLRCILLADPPTALDAAQALLFIGITVVLGLILSAVYVGSVVWASMDAANRGRPWYLVGLMVALGLWPLGLIVWLVYRPPRHV